MLIADPLTFEIFLFTKKLSALINFHFTQSSQHSILKIPVSKQIDSEECQKLLEVNTSPGNTVEKENLTHKPSVLLLQLHN